MGSNLNFRISKGLVSSGGSAPLSGSYYVAGGTETDVNQILAAGTNQLVTVAYGPAGSSSGNLQAIKIYSAQNCTIITNGVPAADAQTITITGTPTGGTFVLGFKGAITAPIAYNAAAVAVQSALQALATIGAGNVTCTGGALPGTGVVCTFAGTLATGLQPLIVAGEGGLTGGSFAGHGRLPHDTGHPPGHHHDHGEYPRALGHLLGGPAPLRRGRLRLVPDQRRRHPPPGEDIGPVTNAITIQGIDLVKRAFRELKPRLAKKVIRQAERKAAKLFAAAILAHAPQDTGLLKRTVKVRSSKGPRVEGVGARLDRHPRRPGRAQGAGWGRGPGTPTSRKKAGPWASGSARAARSLDTPPRTATWGPRGPTGSPASSSPSGHCRARRPRPASSSSKRSPRASSARPGPSARDNPMAQQTQQQQALNAAVRSPA